MSQGQPTRRVKNGPPWWLWGLLLMVTFTIVIAVVVSAIPEDPQEIYKAATNAIEARDKEGLAKNLASLRRFPEYAAHVSYLDGKYAALETRDIKALEFFKAALDNEELKPLALEEIGKGQMRMGEFTAAIKTYEDAIEAASGSSQLARLSLAQLYYSVGALTLAEATLERVLELDESNTDARALRGNIRLETGRLNEAVDDLQQLLATPGDRASANPRVVTDCAAALLDIGDAEQLKEFYAENESFISDPRLQVRLMIAAGELDAADAMLRTAEELKVNAVQKSHYSASLALARGDLKTAVSEIETVFSQATRERSAFKLAEKIFEKSGDDEKLRIVKANLEQFERVNAEFVDIVTNQCANVTDFDARVKAAELQKQMGDVVAAHKWYTMAAMLDAKQTITAVASMRTLYERLPMFVQFPLPEKKGPGTEALDTAGKEDTAPESDAETANKETDVASKNEKDQGAADDTKQKQDSSDRSSPEVDKKADAPAESESDAAKTETTDPPKTEK